MTMREGNGTPRPRPIRVMCVDDNMLVGDAVEVQLRLAGGFEWLGWVMDAGTMLDEAPRRCPDIILLDIDMPGMDPFEAMVKLQDSCPETRVVMLSGHVRTELIDRAFEAGAWGYLSKNDSAGALVASVRRIVEGECVIGTEPQVEHGKRR